MIPVTKTFLPPQEEYQAILKRAWDSGWVTNRGDLVKELEEKLKAYLNVSNILATTNGTLPLQIAIKALKLKGEIITTPFSYVATTSSIVWEGCKPVFVDIHPEYLTIDENKIEEAITQNTSAILATHVFGNPCDVDTIDRIAKKYDLKVIYDAAHCFGVTYKGKSMFEYGDVSTCSFHATKIFHTGEGGALFSKNRQLFEKLFYHHNFGHKGYEDFQGLGTNAKMSELQAALGLCILPYMDTVLAERLRITNFYKNNLNFLGFRTLTIRTNTDWNCSYFPIVFEQESILLKVKAELEKFDIFPRRYFYPGLNYLPYLDVLEFKVSDSVSKNILALPVYAHIDKKSLSQIVRIINSTQE